MVGHPIENIMKTTMENIKDMIDVSTIVGDAVETGDGTVIIPISKVSLGFVAGGGEYKEAQKEKETKRKEGGEGDEAENEVPFVGGTGAGVNVNPIAFLVVGDGKIKLLPVQFGSPIDRIVEMVPQVVEEVQELMGSRQKKEEKTKKIEERVQ